MNYIFFNNRDTVGFIESCCDQGTVFQYEFLGDVIKKQNSSS